MAKAAALAKLFLPRYKHHMSSLNKRQITYPEASLTLAISAAEGRLLLALGREAGGAAELLFAHDWQATAQGVELLAPALDFALSALKLTPHHIGRIAAVSGPGSFTGLRLSIISAAGLARAIGAAQAGIPYLPLLAGQAAKLVPHAGSEFWAVTHARRDLVHAQGFNAAPSGLAPVSDILVLGLDEAAALLQGRNATLFGSGLSKNREFFASALPKSRLLDPSFDQPLPGFLLRAALAAEYGQADIEPIYARQSDAEENLAQIAAKLGLDPAEAQKRLDSLLSAPPENSPS